MLGLSADARRRSARLLERTDAQSGAERRYPIPATDSVNVDHAAQVIVVRLADHVYVFALSCPHQNNAVKWVQKTIASSARSTIPSTSQTAFTRPDGRPGTWTAT